MGKRRETLREGTREAETLGNSVEEKRKRVGETRNSVKNTKARAGSDDTLFLSMEQVSGRAAT